MLFVNSFNYKIFTCDHVEILTLLSQTRKQTQTYSQSHTEWKITATNTHAFCFMTYLIMYVMHAHLHHSNKQVDEGAMSLTLSMIYQRVRTFSQFLSTQHEGGRADERMGGEGNEEKSELSNKRELLGGKMHFKKHIQKTTSYRHRHRHRNRHKNNKQTLINLKEQPSMQMFSADFPSHMALIEARMRSCNTIQRVRAPVRCSIRCYYTFSILTPYVHTRIHACIYICVHVYARI